MGTGKGPQSTAKSKKNDYDLHSLEVNDLLTVDIILQYCCSNKSSSGRS